MRVHWARPRSKLLRCYCCVISRLVCLRPLPPFPLPFPLPPILHPFASSCLPPSSRTHTSPHCDSKPRLSQRPLLRVRAQVCTEPRPLPPCPPSLLPSLPSLTCVFPRTRPNPPPPLPTLPSLSPTLRLLNRLQGYHGSGPLILRLVRSAQGPPGSPPPSEQLPPVLLLLAGRFPPLQHACNTPATRPLSTTPLSSSSSTSSSTSTATSTSYLHHLSLRVVDAYRPQQRLVPRCSVTPLAYLIVARNPPLL